MTCYTVQIGRGYFYKNNDLANVPLLVIFYNRYICCSNNRQCFSWVFLFLKSIQLLLDIALLLHQHWNRAQSSSFLGRSKDVVGHSERISVVPLLKVQTVSASIEKKNIHFIFIFSFCFQITYINYTIVTALDMLVIILYTRKDLLKYSM